jgi:hypothetical protein
MIWCLISVHGADVNTQGMLHVAVEHDCLLGVYILIQVNDYEYEQRFRLRLVHVLMH